MSFEPGPLVFQSSPVPLLELSAVRVAALIWQREIANLLTCIDPIGTSLKKAMPAVNFTTGMPASIGSLIDKYLLIMKKSTINWVEFTYERIIAPHQNSKFEILKYVDLLHWLPNGNLDYELTAKNLIARSKLTIEFKYRLACCYCFEDDVCEMWPKVQRYARTESQDRFMYYVICYWDKRMRDRPYDPNRLHWIDSIDNWAQVCHFWNRLKSRVKAEAAFQLITRLREPAYTFRLLSLLTEIQLKKVIKRCVACVICDLIAVPQIAEYALQTWRYVRNVVTRKQFIDLFRLIRTPSICSRLHMSIYLYELWIITPKRLKNYVLENDVYLEEILNVCLVSGVNPHNLSREVRLLMELLRHKSLNYRFEYWCENALHLIMGVDPDRLNELMKLCLGSDEEVANYKKMVLLDYSKIDLYCSSMISGGFLDEIHEFLNFCSSDQTIVKDLKRKFIFSKDQIILCVRNSAKPWKMRKFEEFISDIYPEEDCRKNLRRHMVISPNAIVYLHEAITWGVLCPVKNFVQLFLTREDDLQIVKNCFRQLCRLILIEAKFSRFHIGEWNEFLLWCLGDDEKKFITFKQSISIDDVFDNVFRKIIVKLREKFTPDCTVDDYARIMLPENDPYNEWDFEGHYLNEKPMDDFDKVNALLMWYFASKTKVDQFKKKKSANYDKPCCADCIAVDAVIKLFFKPDN